MATRHLLSAKFVAKALAGDVEPGRHPDGDRLFLWVRGNSSPNWIFRYTFPAGRRRDMGLGTAQVLTLAQARRAAQEAREMLEHGVDPLDARKRAADALQGASEALPTLRAMAIETHKAVAPSFRNSKHKAQWLASVMANVPDAVLDAPIAEVRATDILGFLPAVMHRIPATGHRLKQRLSVIFDHAVLTGRAQQNPVVLLRSSPALPTLPRGGHHKALPVHEVPVLFQRLDAMDSTSARALQFGMLTADRTGDILGATWAEIDVVAKTWTIAASRMKGKREFVAFLSDPALAVLEQQRGQHAEYVFPSPVKPGRPMSNMSMLTVLRRLGVADQTTVHGLCRTCFSTWANEAGIRGEVIEASLAHVEKDKTRAAYNHAQYVIERRDLIARWGAFVTSAR